MGSVVVLDLSSRLLAGLGRPDKETIDTCQACVMSTGTTLIEIRHCNHPSPPPQNQKNKKNWPVG
jgi:hypothetical protein